MERWQGRPVPDWAREWRVPELRVFGSVGSTNDVAAEMAVAGAAQGTLVLAEEQTKGRGRRGRAWTARHGASLSMSMVLRPLTPAASRILTLRLGLAAAAAIEETLPLNVALKWPNDLVVDGRKLGGILCEASLAEDRVHHVVAGIGLNLRRPDGGWSPELAGRAISMEEAIADSAPTASTPPRLEPAPLVARIAAHWQAVTADPRDVLSESERDRFRARDALRGRRVAVNGRAAGTAEGLTPAGALRLRGDDGWAEITAGSVRATETMTGESA